MNMFNKALLASVLAIASMSAFAGNGNGNGSTTVGGSVVGGIGGQVTTFSGDVSSKSSVSTGGFSEALSGVKGNGTSFQSNQTVGGGTAISGGSITPTGVETHTATSGYATSVTVGHITGSGADVEGNFSGGGVGTDFKAKSSGTFGASAIGGSIEFGAFGELNSYHANHGIGHNEQ